MTTLVIIFILVLLLGTATVVGIINLIWLLLAFGLIAWGVLAIIGALDDKNDVKPTVITSIVIILIGLWLLKVFF